jgi:hypothetical protein
MTSDELLEQHIEEQRRQWLDRLRVGYAERNTDREIHECWEDEDSALWPEFEARLRAAWHGDKPHDDLAG